jgi:segregation and condensation protein B
LDLLAPVARSAVAASDDGDKSLRVNDLRRLEAVLLLSREPLTSRKLAQLAQLEDGTQARTLVRKLNQLLDDAGRAFRVEEVAGGYQLLTRQKFASWLRRLGHIPSEIRLSTPALETLAVVAYRQPVTKADIEAIRGVNCGEILRQLMERDLVRIGGRSEELGRPYLYTTTKRFLQQFGLRSLEDLPRAEILRAAVVPPVGKAVTNGHHTFKSNPLNPQTDISKVDKESDVSVTLSPELSYEEQVARRFGSSLTASPFVPDVRLDDDDDDFEDEDLDDEEEDDEFEDELDEEDDEDEDLDEDEDFEDDEEWEEVEDEEDEDDDFDDEEDEDWDDEEDEDLDDEDEDLDDEE